jgi:hypothetical protein
VLSWDETVENVIEVSLESDAAAALGRAAA